MKKYKSDAVAEAVKTWQRCRREDLPRAFYAYNDVEFQSERVVTYRIGKAGLKKLLKYVKLDSNGDPRSEFHFKIHLGLKKKLLTSDIPKQPAFMLFIQALNTYPKTGHEPSAGDYAGSVELNWEKNSRFSATMADNTDSEANALSAAGAYLFVQSWMETPEGDLALPFTAVSRVLGKRVNSYRFAHDESVSIYRDILASLNGKTPLLDVHLGNGLAVWQHPFSFRPVIEVRDVMTNGGSPQTARINGGAVNADGHSFYDFGNPEPPPPPKE